MMIERLQDTKPTFVNKGDYLSHSLKRTLADPKHGLLTRSTTSFVRYTWIECICLITIITILRIGWIS